MSILKSAKAPPGLEAKIAGESLGNDGIGVVLYAALVALAVGATGAATGSHGDMTVVKAAALFVQEAGGGILVGGLLSLVCFHLLKRIDDAVVEILLTLALVLAVISLGKLFHVSGLLGCAVAGLMIGNQGKHLAMSANTRSSLFNFWTVLDETLNSILFLLLGLEVLLLRFDTPYLLGAAAIIPLVLFARFVAVGLPVKIFKVFGTEFSTGATRVLTWGGLRGGISVALALALPETEWKAGLLTITWLVVAFSVVVQGATVGALVRRFSAENENA